MVVKERVSALMQIDNCWKDWIPENWRLIWLSSAPKPAKFF
jgi:hypothetical protein